MPVRILQKYSIVTLYGVFFTIIVVLFIRKQSSFVTPQFWAEDGAVFFQQAFDIGIKSFFQPYSGYLHFIPRLVAYIASFFPLKYIPAIYNYSALLSTLFVIGYIYNKRICLPYKNLLALSIVLVPSYGEVFITITNIQWIAAVLYVLLVLQEEPKKHIQAIMDILLLTVIGLTGPFIIFSLPLFAIKYYMIRTRHSLLLMLCVLFLAAIQFYFVLTHAAQLSLPISSSQVSISNWIDLLGYRMFPDNFLPNPQGMAGNFTHICAFLMLLLPAFIIYLAASNRKLLWPVSVFLYWGIVILAASLYRLIQNGALVALFAGHNGDRYFYVFSVMLMWSSILCFQARPIASRYAKMIYFFMVISSLTHLESFVIFKDYHWAQSVENVKLGTDVYIPINPEGWFVHFHSSLANCKQPLEVTTNSTPKAG